MTRRIVRVRESHVNRTRRVAAKPNLETCHLDEWLEMKENPMRLKAGRIKAVRVKTGNGHCGVKSKAAAENVQSTARAGVARICHSRTWRASLHPRGVSV